VCPVSVLCSVCIPFYLLVSVDFVSSDLAILASLLCLMACVPELWFRYQPGVDSSNKLRGLVSTAPYSYGDPQTNSIYQ